MNKPDQHAREVMIHACRGEAGLEAVRQWVQDQLAALRWMNKMGEDIYRAQGEGLAWTKLLKVMEVGPMNKGDA